MRSGVAGFQPARLAQARMARGMTQIALARTIGRTSGTLSKWESGEQHPEVDALDRLSQCLGLPSSWFLKPVPDYGDSVCFFRSNVAATKAAQSIAQVRLKWLNELSLTLQQWLEWPEINLPTLDKVDYKNISEEEIEEAANLCRNTWKLGLGPISNMLLVLENAGVICTREELGYTRMDGASQWFKTDERPYVFLAADKANAVRSRFDAAHELGHLVLHRSVSGLEFTKRNPEIERQAHRFASAFLLPAESFAAEVSRPSLDTFLALKPRWKVSIAAMIVRCFDLNIIDEAYATRLWKNYSARGWRRGEPLDDSISVETARILPRAIDLMLSSGVFDKNGIALTLGLSYSDSESLCGLPVGYFSNIQNQVSAQIVRLKTSNSSSQPGTLSSSVQGNVINLSNHRRHQSS